MSINSYIKKHINKDNFSNKNVFITGANSGIGFELAKHVTLLGSNVTLLCRNKEKAEAAIKELKSINPNTKIEFIPLDLADLSSIKSCIEILKTKDIDMFINNAGVFRLPKSKTKDGFEIIMGTNYLGNLYLSNLLLPYLSTLKHTVKYLYETSVTSLISKIDYEDFFMDKKYKEMKIYGRSKVGINNLFFYFKEMYSNSNITFYLTHPGVAYTPLIYKGYRFKILKPIIKGGMKLVFHSPKKASLTMLSALNQHDSVMIGPRGLFQVSGYPKKINIKQDKKYKKCIEIGNNLISKNI